MRLCIDDTFEWCGSKFYVYDFEYPSVLFFKDDGDKKIIRMNHLSLISDPTFKVKKNDRKSSLTSIETENNMRDLLDTLPEKRKALAIKKKSIIEPILIYDDVMSGNLYAAQTFYEKFQCYLNKGEKLDRLGKKELVERVAAKHDYSARQIFRLLAAFNKSETEREHHGIEGLVSKAHLNTHNRVGEIAIPLAHPKKSELILDTIFIRLPTEYVPILKRELEKFIVKKRRKVNLLHENIEIACTAVGLKPLEYDTVYKIVDRIDKYVMERINKGDIADPKLIKEKASNQFAMAPLHVIELDHARLPITLIDPETGAELGEPWLTLGICVFTRMVWGFNLSFNEPSGQKVMRTLLNGICFKNAKEKYGTINDWEMHGFPTVIFMDNGSDFTSTYVKSMIEDVLGAEPRYRPIATPRFGGVIERYFGTVNTSFLNQLLGTREKNDTDKDTKEEARLESILTLDNLRELLVHYITDVYHHKPHEGLPIECDTPVARLYTAMDTMGSLPFISEEDEPYYKLQLLPTDMRSYRQDGIRLDNVKYGSPETTRFISKKQKKNCKIKFDDDDISKIFLLDPKSMLYIEVPAISPPAEAIQGMSRRLYAKVRKNLIAEGEITKQQIPGSALVSKGKLKIREKYNQMVSTNTSARRRALKQGFDLQVGNKTGDFAKSQEPISKVQQLVLKLNTEKERK
ncbi:Mu transposase C-terminal domain-containing protein [Paenibacillus sp. FSL H7-0716]|nr:Mu transposase C-terminal domain-containing protein [Paenibacillus odorifer]